MVCQCDCKAVTKSIMKSFLWASGALQSCLPEPKCHCFYLPVWHLFISSVLIKIHWMMNALYWVFSNFWSIFESFFRRTYYLLFKIMTLCFCAPIKWSLLAKHFIPSKIHSYLPDSLWNFVNSLLFNQWFEFPSFVYFTANKKILNVTALWTIGFLYFIVYIHTEELI